MTTFPQTATLGHASFVPHQPAKPLPKLHAIRSARSTDLRKHSPFTIAATPEEFVWVCKALAKRRLRQAERRMDSLKRPALPRHKAK